MLSAWNSCLWPIVQHVVLAFSIGPYIQHPHTIQRANEQQTPLRPSLRKLDVHHGLHYSGLVIALARISIFLETATGEIDDIS
jgi:hypothetical protein